MSVTVPVLVPTTLIDAPITGSLSSLEITVPEICFCAIAALALRTRPTTNIASLLTIKSLNITLLNYSSLVYSKTSNITSFFSKLS